MRYSRGLKLCESFPCAILFQISSAVFHVSIVDIMLSNSKECYLDRLPVEILQNIVDYEPKLACCMRNLLLLGHKHRFRNLAGPKPVWTILGKRQTRHSINRFVLYLDKFLEDNSKFEHVRVSVYSPKWRLTTGRLLH